MSSFAPPQLIRAHHRQRIRPTQNGDLVIPAKTFSELTRDEQTIAIRLALRVYQQKRAQEAAEGRAAVDKYVRVAEAELEATAAEVRFRVAEELLQPAFDRTIAEVADDPRRARDMLTELRALVTK